MSAFTRKNVFVNPFYQEGVGRRTGIVLNKDVRKDSDGFEVFDDYWSESENDATVNTTYAADKENNGTKPTSRRKKSSLKSMPAFSPPVASSEREESKVELPQEVSQAAENASALEADLTGSIIKGPPTSLEPSSALLKFKTRQRLSFSEATSSEESQSNDEDGSVRDEGGSQESGSSSEGTVKAPSSQSELSQEGDSQAETEDEDVEERGTATDSEKQSSQTTSEPSSQEEEVLESEAPSSSQEGAAQIRESKRRSTRGKPPEEVRDSEAPSSSQEGAAQIRESKRRSTRGKPPEEVLESEAPSSSQEGAAQIRESKRRSTRGKPPEKVLESEAPSSSQEGAAQIRESKRRSTRGKPPEEVLESEAPSSSQEGVVQIRESKRRSTRGKPAEAKSQDETTRLHGNQEVNVPKEKGSRKSTSLSKNIVEKEEMIEKEVEGEKGVAVETRRRKSTRQSNRMKIDDEVEKDVDKETKKDTQIGPRKSSHQSNIIVQNEKELEKDNAGKANRDIDTRRKKSTRQSNRGEKDEEEEKEEVEMDVKSRRSRSTGLSDRGENIKDNAKEKTEDAKLTRRRSKKQTNVSAEKEVEVEKDVVTEDKVAEETEGEMVGGTEGDEVNESVTETEEEAEERETETKGGEVREPEKEQTDVGAESEEAMETEAEKIGKTEENVEETIKQKNKKVVASKSNVIEDEEDDDTERHFFCLRTSMAVPSIANLEDEFDVADADSQEFGMMDDNQKLILKKMERTNRRTVAKGKDKGEKKRDFKESREDTEPEPLSKSTRRPTQKGKEENKKSKGQKNRAMKRDSEIYRDDDHKRSKESPKENADVDKGDSKPVTGGKRSKGKKSNKQKDRLQTSRNSSGSASQASSSDTNAGSQLEDDQADAMQDHQKNQRKQRRKKTSNHPARTSKTSKNSEKTADDRTLEMDEDGHSTGKDGSSSRATRSRRGRRSSVHFTTKDMISVSGDISIHQVTSSEEDVENHKKALPTPAALSKDKKKSTRLSKTGAKTQDKLREADHVEEHQSGQSESDSTAESEKETAVQGRRIRRGKKTKKPSKRRSTEATSTTSVAEIEVASGIKKRRVNRQEQETKSQSDASDGNADDHSAHVSMDSQDISHNPATDRSTRGDTPMESPHTSSNGQQEGRSASTGSILKVSQDWGNKRQNKKKKYSILFTEVPLQKAYIIKPDEEDGVRRTRRQRVRPLEYWRNERPLYERRKSGGFALAGILSPEQVEKSVSVKSMRQPAKPKGHLPVTPSNISIHATPPVGTSTVCQPTINVVNPDTNQEVAIDAVATSKMLKFTGPSGLPARPEDPITISKALSQKAFSAGVLTVRPFEEKGSQLVRRDTMVFNVVRGKIAMTLHETSQILQNGDWFFVPKGNVYNIKNLRKDEAKLTFFQLKST